MELNWCVTISLKMVSNKHTNCSAENDVSYFQPQSCSTKAQIFLGFLQRAMSYKYFKQFLGYVNREFSVPYLRIHKTAVKSVSLCAFQDMYIRNIITLIVSWACSVQFLIPLRSTEICFAFWADLRMLECSEGTAHEDLTLFLFLCSLKDFQQLLLYLTYCKRDYNSVL